ncbi:PRC-barrel domain-containing protein [Billgrantia endophytica]|uniref:PRC-barrel domain-containing protein n=1 Tax=Billgrantia endophytica TaxID=2033802 RepID=A0A2N7U6L1_9GAMM|nr:PRC-barrel domain-containing protein [Halomonas endophytica]PMR76067.1 hypothetical protein C1H69_06720 [Halomonas endophytica]
MKKRVMTIAVAAMAGGLAFGTQAVAEEDLRTAQGLYSANDIIGANVYHADDPDDEVGTVENILLDDDRQVTALVVNAGGLWGMGGDDVVVDVDQFSLETELDDDQMFGDGNVTHRIVVDASEEELENFPEYNEDWFNEEREQRRTDGEGSW